MQLGTHDQLSSLGRGCYRTPSFCHLHRKHTAVVIGLIAFRTWKLLHNSGNSEAGGTGRNTLGGVCVETSANACLLTWSFPRLGEAK